MEHVFEAEVIPYAMWFKLWGDLLRGSCVFAFIDNEAAKACWVAGFAHSDVVRRVIHSGTKLEAELDIHIHSLLGCLPTRITVTILRGAHLKSCADWAHPE